MVSGPRLVRGITVANAQANIQSYFAPRNNVRAPPDVISRSEIRLSQLFRRSETLLWQRYVGSVSFVEV